MRVGFVLHSDGPSSLSVFKNLATLAQDFAFAAQLYGKIIIDERIRSVPLNLQTFKPITRSVLAYSHPLCGPCCRAHLSSSHSCLFSCPPFGLQCRWRHCRWREISRAW